MAKKKNRKWKIKREEKEKKNCHKKSLTRRPTNETI